MARPCAAQGCAISRTYSPGAASELTENPGILFGPVDAKVKAERSALRQAAIRYVMSALMTITLVWGGCLSCSQYFVSPMKACCDPHGSCNRKPGTPKSTRECNLQPAVPASAKAPEAAIQVSLASAILPSELAQFATSNRRHADFSTALSEPGSPPDLNLLHSVLRI